MTTPQTPTPNRRRSLVLIAAVFVVALAGALIVSLTRDDSGGGSGDDTATTDTAMADTADPVSSQTQPVVVEGAPLPVLAETDTAVGLAAPRVTGMSFDGSPVEILTDGRPTVIGIFTHWCPHCQREVRTLADHFETAGVPDDVRIVAVSTAVQADEGNFPPSAWFVDEAWPTEVLADDVNNTVARAYGLSAFPFWLVVDADGEVLGRAEGEIGGDEFDLLVEAARTGTAP